MLHCYKVNNDVKRRGGIKIYTLKEARKIAIEITERKFDIPKADSLRRWSYQGLITGAKNFDQRGRGGGRIGLYDETLPVQIAVIAELKEKFELKKLAKFVSSWVINDDVDLSNLYESPQKEKKKGEIYRKPEEAKNLYSNTLSPNIVDKANRMISNMKEAESSSEVKKARKSLLKVVEDFEGYAILSIYSDEYQKYQEKLEKHLN